jgi:hypothetical protein
MNGLARDLDISLRFVWLIVSLAILLVLAAPFVLGPERVARLTPVCESKARYGRPCAFCGMTTGFLAISDGRFEDAERSNRGAIPLYVLFVVNEVCAFVFMFGRRRRSDRDPLCLIASGWSVWFARKRGGLTCKF